MFSVLPALYKYFITSFTFLSQLSIPLSGQHIILISQSHYLFCTEASLTFLFFNFID